MTELHDPAVVRRLFDALERRIADRVRQLVPRQQYGVAYGAPDRDGRKVSVQLFGQDEPAAGFVYGEVEPRDGDHVRIVITPGGDRYVDAVLGRTPPATAEPVASLPTAAAELRGRLLLLTGATGVADTLYVCRKLADDTYAWATVTVV